MEGAARSVVVVEFWSLAHRVCGKLVCLHAHVPSVGGEVAGMFTPMGCQQ